MIDIDRYLLVRTASIYIGAVCLGAVWFWRRPSARAVAGAMLASVWNLSIVLALNVAAAHLGWWSFDARGGLLLGVPVDLYLVWVCLWGLVAALAFPSLSMLRLLLLALVIDLVLMPAASPVVALGPSWLAGETAGLLFGLLPGQMLARWTARDECLIGRAILQVVAFSGLVMFVLPAVVIDGSGSAWSNPLLRPVWQISLIVQVLAVPALLGLTAVQEFVLRGRGTPVPFDPPRRLVTTGIYAYVRNPMQLSAVLLLFLSGAVLQNAWVAAAGVMAHLYSLGLAGWDEDEDLRGRFGEDWIVYRRAVRAWIPRLRPWCPGDRPPARLFVAASCDMCREFGRWFEARGARGILILPAETHPAGSLRRITYEPADGTRGVMGVDAVARAVEHIHCGWALLGFLMRVPIVCQLIQLLADASGAEPRRTVPASRSH
jgi:protein-S-isoprenylcysteine O-methyltransferase Ste14